MKPQRRDYCQFILSTQTNYTQTYMSSHHRYFSHDAINRYLLDDKVSPAVVWLAVKDAIRHSQNACLIFDDSVLDKRHSFKIELVRRQYSGNEHGVIKGIGVVNCLYVNLDTGEYWVVDWRIYNPDADGKTKLDHLREMFDNAVGHKNLPFRTVLMDSCYATKETMLHIDQAGKTFFARSNATAWWTTAAVSTPIKPSVIYYGAATRCFTGNGLKYISFPAQKW